MPNLDDFHTFNRLGVSTWTTIEPIEDLPGYVQVEFHCFPLPGGLGNPVYSATVKTPKMEEEER